MTQPLSQRLRIQVSQPSEPAACTRRLQSRFAGFDPISIHSPRFQIGDVVGNVIGKQRLTVIADLHVPHSERTASYLLRHGHQFRQSGLCRLFVPAPSRDFLDDAVAVAVFGVVGLRFGSYALLTPLVDDDRSYSLLAVAILPGSDFFDDRRRRWILL
ncbi:hypothetical protein [Allorhodopirellula heiligendammensis]|uniref:hypothetical protein n=1 Tax=Allorhodopirellula heiligendammensis TaxID=2714739 RepID=UPI00265DEE9A|nr:hypothetical protein [Allorhodopirellula heiligendammensis]